MILTVRWVIYAAEKLKLCHHSCMRNCKALRNVTHSEATCPHAKDTTMSEDIRDDNKKALEKKISKGTEDGDILLAPHRNVSKDNNDQYTVTNLY